MQLPKRNDLCVSLVVRQPQLCGPGGRIARHVPRPENARNPIRAKSFSALPQSAPRGATWPQGRIAARGHCLSAILRLPEAKQSRPAMVSLPAGTMRLARLLCGMASAHRATLSRPFGASGHSMPCRQPWLADTDSAPRSGLRWWPGRPRHASSGLIHLMGLKYVSARGPLSRRSRAGGRAGLISASPGVKADLRGSLLRRGHSVRRGYRSRWS